MPLRVALNDGIKDDNDNNLVFKHGILLAIMQLILLEALLLDQI